VEETLCRVARKCKSHPSGHRNCKTAKINFYLSHTETTSSEWELLNPVVQSYNSVARTLWQVSHNPHRLLIQELPRDYKGIFGTRYQRTEDTYFNSNKCAQTKRSSMWLTDWLTDNDNDNVKKILQGRCRQTCLPQIPACSTTQHRTTSRLMLSGEIIECWRWPNPRYLLTVFIHFRNGLVAFCKMTHIAEI
jgi:hypothetical protein